MKRREWLMALAVLAGCGARKSQGKFDYGEAKQKYSLHGKILRLKAEDRVAVIQHEKIEGWMEAMTMEFPVPDAAEFGKLKEGAAIRATVNVNDSFYWLNGITLE